MQNADSWEWLSQNFLEHVHYDSDNIVRLGGLFDHLKMCGYSGTKRMLHQCMKEMEIEIISTVRRSQQLESYKGISITMKTASASLQIVDLAECEDVARLKKCININGVSYYVLRILLTDREFYGKIVEYKPHSTKCNASGDVYKVETPFRDIMHVSTHVQEYGETWTVNPALQTKQQQLDAFEQEAQTARYARTKNTRKTKKTLKKLNQFYFKVNINQNNSLI